MYLASVHWSFSLCLFSPKCINNPNTFLGKATISSEKKPLKQTLKLLAGKAKDGADKLRVTANVELSLYLCFVASFVFERNYVTYVRRRLLKQKYELSVIIMVLQNLFYLFFLPVFTTLLGHYMEQPYGGKKCLFEKFILESTNIELYKTNFTYKTVFALLCFKYQSYFYQKLDLKSFSQE